jgi:antitoxin MazE
MKAKLQKIGNSKGIRIPKAILDEIGLETTVELTVEKGRLIIAPVRSARHDWDERFQATAAQEAALLPDNLDNTFDRDEWTW